MDVGYGSNQLSDETLWRQLKNGEREALKVLFLRHYQDLYLYAFKLSGDSYLAKDVVQELFYKVWNRKDHLAVLSSVKSYLWISLRRDIFKSLDLAKQEIISDNIFSHSSMLTFTIEDFMIHGEESQEQRKALMEAMDTLPERQKEAIVLKFFNGMGYGEIEQIMSVSYQTARNYVYHGVKTLKRELRGRVLVSAAKPVI